MDSSSYTYLLYFIIGLTSCQNITLLVNFNEESDHYYSQRGVRAVDSIYIPVPVNIVFIGFDGDGKSGVVLKKEDLLPWLTEIEHTLPHIKVKQNHHIQPEQTSFIKYQYSTQLVEVSQLVSTVISESLLSQVRAEDPHCIGHSNPHPLCKQELNKRNTYYVDALKFSSLVSSLCESLQLDGYVFLVMAGEVPVVEGEVYGYRYGFSDKEIETLHQNFNYTLKTTPWTDEVKLPRNDFGTKKSWMGGEKDIHWIDKKESSKKWAEGYLKNHFKTVTVPLDTNCNEEGSDCGFTVEEANQNILDLALQIASNGTTYEKNYLYSVQNHPGVSETCLTELWIGRGRYMFLDFNAGPFTWGPTVSAGLKVQSSLPNIPSKHDATGHIGHDSTLSPDINKRKNLLQHFLNLYRRLCQEEITTWCQDLLSLIEEFKKKEHFQETNSTEELEFSTAEDNFLSKLGDIISRTYRNVITPPAAAFPVMYTKRVVFQFYLIQNHNRFSPLSPENLNMRELKLILKQLALPSQEFTFVTKVLELGSEPDIELALFGSLTAEKSKGTNSNPEEILLLNSKALHTHLTALKKKSSILQTSDNYDLHNSKHVPIYLFSLDGDEKSLFNRALFIDKPEKLAEAGEEMVFIVQSGKTKWKTSWECNGKPIHFNLRNPLSQGLYAIMQFLGGPVAPHLSYDSSLNEIVEDWLWSVGNSPMSYTSCQQGHYFSSMQVDALRRNWVINSLDDALNSLNTAIKKLEDFQEYPGADPNVKKMIRYYEDIKTNLFNVVLHVHNLDFDSAIESLHLIEKSTQQFVTSANYYNFQSELRKCIKPDQSNDEEETDIFLVYCFIFNVGIILMGIVLEMILRTRRSTRKLKIN